MPAEDMGEDESASSQGSSPYSFGSASGDVHRATLTSSSPGIEGAVLKNSASAAECAHRVLSHRPLILGSRVCQPAARSRMTVGAPRAAIALAARSSRPLSIIAATANEARSGRLDSIAKAASDLIERADQKAAEMMSSGFHAITSGVSSGERITPDKSSSAVKLFRAASAIVLSRSPSVSILAKRGDRVSIFVSLPASRTRSRWLRRQTQDQQAPNPSRRRR